VDVILEVTTSNGRTKSCKVKRAKKRTMTKETEHEIKEKYRPRRDEYA
jgi:hypothetical protein